MTTQIRSIGDLITVARAAANTAATAGGAGDDTAVTGTIIDRMAIGTPQSAVLAIPSPRRWPRAKPFRSPTRCRRATIPG